MPTRFGGSSGVFSSGRVVKTIICVRKLKQSITQAFHGLVARVVNEDAAEETAPERNSSELRSVEALTTELNTWNAY